MTLNSNILMAANDYIKGASILAKPTNSVLNFPYSYFQNENMYEFGRFWTGYTGQTWIAYDFGTAKAVDLVAVLKHNMGQLSQWRVRISNDPTFAVTVFDSGWVDVTPPVTGMGGLIWGTFDWGGVAPLSIVNSYNRHAYMPLTETVVGRYIRYDFNDEAEVFSRPDSYVQIARLWASAGYQPTLNVDYGAKIIPIDETGVKTMRSGARQYDDRDVKRRAIQMEFAELPHKELLYNIYGPIYMQGGKRTPIIVLLFPLDPETFVMEALYGNLKDTEAATHVQWERMQTPMTLEESV